VDELEPIENHLRSDILFGPTDGSLVVVRGGPFSIEKFVAHILRQSREYSYLGQPMTSLSVSVTSNERDLERLLAGPPNSRSTYATASVQAILDAELLLLPTFTQPHYDLTLPDYKTSTLELLAELFRHSQPNPFIKRRR
jgi:hypothetical protein